MRAGSSYSTCELRLLLLLAQYMARARVAAHTYTRLYTHSILLGRYSFAKKKKISSIILISIFIRKKKYSCWVGIFLYTTDDALLLWRLYYYIREHRTTHSALSSPNGCYKIVNYKSVQLVVGAVATQQHNGCYTWVWKYFRCGRM